jgi:hypothetical protein
VEQYFSAILSLEPSQNYAAMLGLLVQFCTNHKEMDAVSQHKVSVQHGAGGLAALGLGGVGTRFVLWPLPVACVNPGVDTGVTVVDSSPAWAVAMHQTLQRTGTLITLSQRLLPS